MPVLVDCGRPHHSTPTASPLRDHPLHHDPRLRFRFRVRALAEMTEGKSSMNAHRWNLNARRSGLAALLLTAGLTGLSLQGCNSGDPADISKGDTVRALSLIHISEPTRPY